MEHHGSGRETFRKPEHFLKAAECMTMVNSWKDQARAASGALREQMTLQDISPEERRRKRVELDQAFFKRCIDQVIHEAERYKHVFFTEHGSFYFVLNSGESMRLKKVAGEDGEFIFSAYDSFNPLMLGVVFLDPSEYVSKKEVIDNLQYHSSLVLKTVPLRIGCQPFEFEPVQGVGRRAIGQDVGIIERSADGAQMTLRGWSQMQDQSPPQNFNGYPRHIGHPVSRIIV